MVKNAAEWSVGGVWMQGHVVQGTSEMLEWGFLAY